MNESRAKKGIRNVQIVILFYALSIVIGFFNRKVLLDIFGIDILGLNTTIVQICSFLNLAELGISSAVAFTLYKPLLESDYKSIKEIVTVQAWFYKKIAIFITIIAVFISFFFPIIFPKIPLYYAYGFYYSILLGSILTYVANYKQIVLTADQKDYEVIRNLQGFNFLKTILQMLSISYLPYPFLWWILFEILCNLLRTIRLNQLISKKYPWLKVSIRKGKDLTNKYKAILTKTKQLFFHKIGGFIINQSSPIIVYTFSTLQLVGIYGSFLLITTSITNLLSQLSNSLSAGIGNLVAEGNTHKTLYLFKELYSFQLWMVSIISFTLYNVIQDFVILWLGKGIILNNNCILLITISLFIKSTRTFNYFIAAYGQFQDIFAPIIESTIFILASCTLGHFYGLEGVLLGGLFSDFIVTLIWKPYFLYSRCFHTKFIIYIKTYIKYLLLIAISIICSHFILTYLNLAVRNWIDLITTISIVFLIYSIISTLIFIFILPEFKSIIIRIKKVIYE